MLYSPTAHAGGTGTGFYFDGAANAPSDAFQVSDADARGALNAAAASTYAFSAPAAGQTYGTLTITPPTAAQSLADTQAAQSAVIASASLAAQTAALSFATAAGTTATFPMDNDSQRKYLGAYTRYVVAAVALPSGFGFKDTSGAIIAMTTADIENFATAAFAQVDGAIVKEATLQAEIQAATTDAAVQAVVW